MGNKQPAMTTDGRRPSWMFKQVDRLVGASEATPDLAFLHRILTLCSLPRTNPGERLQYVRENGPCALVMIAGAKNKLPYGPLPRLMMAYVCRAAVQTRNPEVLLGNSLSDFMKELGMWPRGSSRTRIREQMNRLFNASVSLIYENKRDRATVNAQIAASTEFWWNERKPEERSLWQSKVVLSHEFFNEIISHPVPLDMNILKALRRSPLGLDLYVWLNYRTFGLGQPCQLTWPQLYRQFGANPDRATNNRTVQDFRKDCLRELKNIKIAWPGLDYATPAGVLELRPSEPSVPSRQIRLLHR